MGLDIAVGLLDDLRRNDEDEFAHFQSCFTSLNAVLQRHGLPHHSEPLRLPPLRSRAAEMGYPYSFLHHLRRFAAHAVKPGWNPKPFPKADNPAHDAAVEEQTMMFDSHLLCHSDCEGFYVPVDFGEPIFADEGEIPGGMLGSSQGLMRELVAVAPFLGIELSAGRLPDSEADRLNTLVRIEGPFWIESGVWLSLFEAARLSLEHKTAICFT